MGKKVEFSLDTLMNNPVTKKQIDGFVQELTLCYTKIRQEQEAVKDIVKEAKESLGLPGKMLNGLVAEKLNPGTIDARVVEIDQLEAIAQGLGIIVQS